MATVDHLGPPAPSSNFFESIGAAMALTEAEEVVIMKAVIHSIGKVGSRTDVGGHALVFDQPSTVPGGEDRGPSPLDVMTVAVGACAHYFAAAYLHARGISTEGVTVEVVAEKERVPVPRLGRLAVVVHLPAGVADNHAAGVERAIKRCPAYGTLLYPPEVAISVDRIGEGAGADSEDPGRRAASAG